MIDYMTGQPGIGHVAFNAFGRQEQTSSAHVGDIAASRDDRLQPLLEEGAGRAGIFLQAFLLDCVEHGHAGGAGHRIAAKRVEVAGLGTEFLDEFWAQRHAGDRKAVAHRFAHGHHVGHQPVALEAPEGFPRAREAGLHLVGDEDTALGADQIDGGFEEARRIGIEPVAGKDRIHDEGGRLDAVGAHRGNGGGEIRASAAAPLLASATV